MDKKIILTNRFKSLLWRMGMMALAVTIDALMVNLDLFDLPIWAVGIFGHILGEVSKYLNVDVKKLNETLPTK